MTELETLKAKLAVRARISGYEENVVDIRKRIAELEGQAKQA